jgi:hypothetical protein
MMGYFVGDGWIEETTKENGTCMNKNTILYNDTVEPEVLEIIQKVLPITDKIVIAFLVLNVKGLM